MKNGIVLKKAQENYDFVDDFYNGFARFWLDGKWGFIDGDGKEICKRYDYVLEFENGFAPVKLNHKWGLINENGEEICNIKYDFVCITVINGFAYNVWIGTKKYIINKDGKIVNHYG